MDEKKRELLRMYLGWSGIVGEQADLILNIITTMMLDNELYMVGGPTS